MDDRFAAAVGVAIIVGIVWWVLNSRYQAGRLAGIREATADISRACSYHYEVKDQPLPEKVEKALDYIAGALKRGKGDKGKGDKPPRAHRDDTGEAKQQREGMPKTHPTSAPTASRKNEG